MHNYPACSLGRTWLAAAVLLAGAIAPGRAPAADDPTALLKARRADLTAAQVMMLPAGAVYRIPQKEHDVVRLMAGLTRTPEFERVRIRMNNVGFRKTKLIFQVHGLLSN